MDDRVIGAPERSAPAPVGIAYWDLQDSGSHSPRNSLLSQRGRWWDADPRGVYSIETNDLKKDSMQSYLVHYHPSGRSQLSGCQHVPYQK